MFFLSVLLTLLIYIFLIASFPQKKVGDIPEGFLPEKFPWRLERGGAECDSFYPSTLPRMPKVVFSVNISADMGERLATAMVEGDKIFLADRRGVYALKRDDGSLIWGVEIYLDNLSERAVSYPQPVEKWRALGLWKFVESYGVGKYLYVVTRSDSGGSVLSFDKDTGDLKWRVDLEPLALSTEVANLLVAEGSVYVGGGGGYVFCITEGGQLLWSNKVGTYVGSLAYGGGVLFVTSREKLYAVTKTGEIIWVFEHSDVVNSPSYRGGKIILSDSRGNLLALSREGELLWKIHLGGTKLLSAVSDHNVFVVRDGEMVLSKINLYGEIEGNFTTTDGKGGRPTASRDMVIVPVVKHGGSGIYLLWRGLTKIGEFTFGGRWMPTVSAAYGEIYVVVDPNTLYKLADVEKPKIVDVETEIQPEALVVNVKAYDGGSAIHKVLLVYRVDNSPWKYIEMEIARRYVVEPIGGYGFAVEDYTAKISTHSRPVEFYIVAIDNSGNYEISKIYSKNPSFQ
ncbi:MAG: PQQ-binding-like beta-propeller repeat protein [Pyrobaculum sp.]